MSTPFAASQDLPVRLYLFAEKLQVGCIVALRASQNETETRRAANRFSSASKSSGASARTTDTHNQLQLLRNCDGAALIITIITIIIISLIFIIVVVAAKVCVAFKRAMTN